MHQLTKMPFCIKVLFVIHFTLLGKILFWCIFSEINKMVTAAAAMTTTTHDDDDNEILYYFCIYDACGADINQRHIWHMIINLLICINNCIATFFLLFVFILGDSTQTLVFCCCFFDKICMHFTYKYFFVFLFVYNSNWIIKIYLLAVTSDPVRIINKWNE